MRSKRLSLNNTSEIKSNIKIAHEVLIDKITNSQIIKGSGWLFVKILKVNIGLAKYKPLAGSSYIELPKELVAKRAIVNVQNKDNECFKWAVLSSLYPASKNAQRVSNYNNLVHGIDFSMLTYPVSIDNIHKSEKKNNIGINLYRSQILQSKLKTETKESYVSSSLLQKSSLINKEQAIKPEKNIHLLYVENEALTDDESKMFIGDHKCSTGLKAQLDKLNPDQAAKKQATTIDQEISNQADEM